MIGKVVFRKGPETIEALLDEETNWHCRDADCERFLNVSCRFGAGCGAEEGLGWQTLSHAAALVNGEAIFS